MKDYSIKIIIATHKNYEMPKENIYLPIHVGAYGKDSIGYQRDDIGDNISNLNQYYCELTGLYWAWKNLDTDYIGLVHYRRLFSIKNKIINKGDIEGLLGKIKLFTPKKRRYFIETLKTHYEHTHSCDHIGVTRNSIKELCPDYLINFDKVINRTWGYMFNMMIIEKNLLNNYCIWLFNILSDVFNKIDTSEYSAFSKRYVGRLSEILFNVWIDKQLELGILKKDEMIELSCNIQENWIIKIPAFLKAKFFKSKYDKSF